MNVIKDMREYVCFLNVYIFLMADRTDVSNLIQNVNVNFNFRSHLSVLKQLIKMVELSVTPT